MTTSSPDVATIRLRLAGHASALKTRVTVLDVEEEPCGPWLRVEERNGRVDLVRSAHPSEGDGVITVSVDLHEAVSIGVGELERIDRLQRREASITNDGYTIDAPPSWSLLTDQSTVALLKAIGHRPCEVLNSRTRNPVRMPLGLAQTWPDDGRGHVVDVLTRGWICETGIRRGDGASAGSWWYVDMPRPQISIVTNVAASDTVMVAAVGRPAAEVVMLPGIDGKAEVEAMTCREASVAGLHVLSVHLRPRPTPLATAPVGVVVDWLGI